YQTLVGAWPFDMRDAAARARFRDRLAGYLTKAMRESKVHSGWLSPHDDYEQAMLRFLDALLDRTRPNRFLELFEPFEARVAELGMHNSLAQLLIKITAPGVQDFYQGGELWDLQLVDPDNRRPVDYGVRRRALTHIADAPAAMSACETLRHRADGRVK